MKRIVVAAGVGLLALGLAACGGNHKAVSGNQPPSRTVVQTGSASGKPLKTFTVTETDFTLTPSAFRISKPGTYTFHAVNKGHVEHSLEVDGRGVQKALPSKLAPAQSGNLTLLLGPGTYEIYCPVDDHRGKGMRGTIDVAGAKSQPTSTTTTTSSAGGGY